MSFHLIHKKVISYQLIRRLLIALFVFNIAKKKKKSNLKKLLRLRQSSLNSFIVCRQTRSTKNLTAGKFLTQKYILSLLTSK